MRAYNFCRRRKLSRTEKTLPYTEKNYFRAQGTFTEGFTAPCWPDSSKCFNYCRHHHIHTSFLSQALTACGEHRTTNFFCLPNVSAACSNHSTDATTTAPLVRSPTTFQFHSGPFPPRTLSLFLSLSPFFSRLLNLLVRPNDHSNNHISSIFLLCILTFRLCVVFMAIISY